MKIAMFLGQALIDTLGIEKIRISEPGYLGTRIKNLRKKHASVLLTSSDEPEFLLYPLHASAVSNVNANSFFQSGYRDRLATKLPF